MLGGKVLFEVPQASSLIRQEALDWYFREFNQMVKKIDTSLPVGKQLDLLDKLGQSLRKAAETALIDKGAVGEFAERLFKPSLDQVIQKLRSKAGLSGEAMQKKALDEMRLPAIGCFVAGTLVHTKDGLKPIEQIKIGDWVLSRPESPEQGTETGYKRVTKTFRFEDKEVVRFWWAPNSQAAWEQTEWVYATPNHPVWLNPHGWVAMGRLHLPGKLRPGTIHRGDDEWLSRELILADGSSGAMLDVMDLFCTDQQEVAFLEDDDPDWGVLVDFSCPVARIIPEELAYDYEKWGDPTNETRARYTTTVYNFEVEDWHTYFVGKMGVWVHNTNCLEATLEVAPGKGDIDQLLTGVLQVGSQAQKFKTLRKSAEIGASGNRGQSRISMRRRLLPTSAHLLDRGHHRHHDAAGDDADHRVGQHLHQPADAAGGGFPVQDHVMQRRDAVRDDAATDQEHRGCAGN